MPSPTPTNQFSDMGEATAAPENIFLFYGIIVGTHLLTLQHIE